jgi:hypothetical protein
MESTDARCEVKITAKRSTAEKHFARTQLAPHVKIREILVKNISGPEEMPTDSGSFDCVRLAPHFAQEDRDKK